MAWWGNIAGTVTGYLRLGLSGVQLKNDAGALSVRNAGDSAVADAKFGAWLNTDGSENYKCRAWVNFNGSGTVAIRASGNVSSITDNGTGDYTVNFTSALIDANYAVVGTAQQTIYANSDCGSISPHRGSGMGARTTTGVRLDTTNTATTSGTAIDMLSVYVAILR